MQIEDQLIGYFIEHAKAEVTVDTHLLEEHVIDSMGVMDLLAFIESTYNLELDREDLTIENFATINDIKSLIVSKRADS